MKRILLAASALALAMTLLTAAPASAGPATGNYTYGSGLLVAQFRQNVDGTGYSWVQRGPAQCTTSTSNEDYGKSSMNESNWNDVVSYIQDYQQCDVKIYQDTGYSVALTGYIHYGSTGSTVASGLNNRTSSYHLS